MIQFPLPNGRLVVVVEPGNLQRLKEGRPLLVGKHMICFTPDMHAFLREIGCDLDMPPRGETVVGNVSLTPDELESALRRCQQMPEVSR